MAPEQEYSQLRLSIGATEDDRPLEESEWDTLAAKKTWRKSFRNGLPYLVAFICGLLLGLAIFAVLSTVMSSTSQRTSGELVSAISTEATATHEVNPSNGFVINPQTGEAKCGNNWQDAKRLGCHFDVMASRWYSHDCYNGAILEQMMTEVEFEWFYDSEHTLPAPKDLVMKGEFDTIYPLYDYHIMHCLYLWRRLHSAVVEHRQLDDDVYSYGHTLHCTRLIMGWKMEKNTTTIATSGIPFCRNEPL
ncbi:hypothetical protein VTL71DRAFT_9425 [Oculimacula yallundae]|uniref:Uncharacterized protein n=1 Tax=Oculimacula yallundae TaxID=86028 RepID=A0ABR4BT48_9HELO